MTVGVIEVSVKFCNITSTKLTAAVYRRRVVESLFALFFSQLSIFLSYRTLLSSLFTGSFEYFLWRGLSLGTYYSLARSRTMVECGRYFSGFLQCSRIVHNGH